MLLLLRKNGLTSLFKEVTVFKEFISKRKRGQFAPGVFDVVRLIFFLVKDTRNTRDLNPHPRQGALSKENFDCFEL